MKKKMRQPTPELRVDATTATHSRPLASPEPPRQFDTAPPQTVARPVTSTRQLTEPGASRAVNIGWLQLPPRLLRRR